MATEPDHYWMLGVVPSASAAEIKAAYWRKIEQHRLDVGASPEQMEAVMAAWQVLSDPRRRADYDAARRRPGSARPPLPGDFGDPAAGAFAAPGPELPEDVKIRAEQIQQSPQGRAAAGAIGGALLGAIVGAIAASRMGLTSWIAVMIGLAAGAVAGGASAFKGGSS